MRKQPFSVSFVISKVMTSHENTLLVVDLLPEVSRVITDKGLSHFPIFQLILLPSESPNSIFVSSFSMLLQLKKYTVRWATSLMPDLAPQKRLFSDRFDLLTPNQQDIFHHVWERHSQQTGSRIQSAVHTYDLEGFSVQYKPGWGN